MAALTKDRQTMERHSPGRQVRYKVDATTKIYAGSLVMIVAGYLKPAADTAGGIVVGVSDEQVDNTGAAGALSCDVRAGLAFKLGNNAGAIVQADVGKTALVIDDQTVTDAATTNNIAAGKIEEIDADGGIWVWIA